MKTPDNLFLCADPCSGIMLLAQRTGRAASRRKSIPARFEKADPCSGIMLLAQRVGKTNLPYSIACGRPKKKTLNARLLEC